MIRFLAAAALVLAFVACQPATAPVQVDASDAAPLPAAQMACAHLRALSCPLGSDPNCAVAFSLPSKFGANPACVLGAATLGDLAACNVTCQPQ